MERIQLSNGGFAKVDSDDFEWLSKYTWRWIKPRNIYYVVTGIWIKKQSVHSRMHRFIMNANKGDIVDHVNGNGLDNRKKNLRIVTNAQNCQNQAPQVNKSSKYKGVSWFKKNRKWISYIGSREKRTYLGSFSSEIDAALAYDKKAKELFGCYARLNLNH